VLCAYSLQLCCKDFWQRVSETDMNAWDSQADANVVYAYGNLHSARAAPDVTSSLEQVLRAAAVQPTAWLRRVWPTRCGHAQR
jgi:hypothetical protein